MAKKLSLRFSAKLTIFWGPQAPYRGKIKLEKWLRILWNVHFILLGQLIENFVVLNTEHHRQKRLVFGPTDPILGATDPLHDRT